MAFTNVYSLLDLARAVNGGWGIQICLDTTFGCQGEGMVSCRALEVYLSYMP